MASEDRGPDRRIRDKTPNDGRRVTDSDWARWTNRTRDASFLVIGLAGVANQLFFADPPNPVLYPILASLLGAPFALAMDQRRRSASAYEDKPEDDK